MKRIMKKEEARQLLDRLINSAIRDTGIMKDSSKIFLNSSSSAPQNVVITALSDYEKKLDDLITYLEEAQFPEEVEVSKYDFKDE
jgi:predicted transcriptional regulator